MSIKFFSGLQDDKWSFDHDKDEEDEDEQGTIHRKGSFRFGDVEVPKDLLGLYDASVASTSHTSPHIPSTSSIFSTANVGPSAGAAWRKSVAECNHTHSVTDDGEPVRKCSHDRRVRFDDEHLISGYYDASAPLFNSFEEAKPDDSRESANVIDANCILSNYRRVCQNLGIPAISSVERQIERLPHSTSSRVEVFSVKGERISAAQMEALEEVFRRVQFDILDFEYTFLDDDAAIALSEMFEFYESAHKLNLSFNKQITVRGWTDVFKAVKNSNSLFMLNLRYTSLSEKSLGALCRVLRGTPQPVLSCLHLENVNLYGRNLYTLVCALKYNTLLKELYLGENSLQSGDGAHLYQLITNNYTIQMLDLRNNNLGDVGISKICEALRVPDVTRKSSLTALVLWNNKITANGMDAVAAALCENNHVETVNIGSNPLGEMGICRLRSALGGNGSNLHRLGLQNTQMNCQSAIFLAECLADNSTLIRVDLRDNPGIGSAGLLALHSAMKLNCSITLLNLDQSCTVPANAKVRPYQEDFRRYYDDIKRYCERNKIAALEKIDIVAAEAESLCQEKPRKFDEDVEAKAKEGVKTAAVNVSDSDLSPSDCHLHPKLAGPEVKEKFARSSSLTCAETVADINERIRVLGGSTHSLDETNSDSIKTVKKTCTSPHNTSGLAEWGSLPAIPQASSHAKPVVRKLRRFSVSPSSSTFCVATSVHTSAAPVQGSQCRPKTLALGVPGNSHNNEGPHSAPEMSSSLPISMHNHAKVNDCGRHSDVMTQSCAEESKSTTGVGCHINNNFSQEASTSSASKSKNGNTCLFSKSAESPELSHQNKERNVIAEDVVRDVRMVIGDLINYVVYEESSRIERKCSLLLQTTSFPTGELIFSKTGTPEDATPTKSLLTPSRMVNIAEEVAEETEDMIVSSIVRGMVREVLRREKEELRSTLDRRRKRSGVTPGSAPLYQ